MPVQPNPSCLFHSQSLPSRWKSRPQIFWEYDSDTAHNNVMTSKIYSEFRLEVLLPSFTHTISYEGNLRTPNITQCTRGIKTKVNAGGGEVEIIASIFVTSRKSKATRSWRSGTPTFCVKNGSLISTSFAIALEYLMVLIEHLFWSPKRKHAMGEGRRCIHPPQRPSMQYRRQLLEIQKITTRNQQRW